MCCGRTDLDEVIRMAVRRYARHFISKKIVLHYEETGARVLTDEKWLGFVIEQLLSNALKYTHEGSITIGMEEGRLTITDTGIGIRAEDLPRVCEKGYTGYNGHANQKSTGIGLYLCSTILKKLGHSFTKHIAGRNGNPDDDRLPGRVIEESYKNVRNRQRNVIQRNGLHFSVLLYWVQSRKGERHMAILEVRNLKKIYTTRFGGNQVQALADLNFSVEKGEYVAIMGESGSGKTTLLNILAALDKPTAGEVLLNNKNIVTLGEREISKFRRENLGFVFQDFNLLDHFSLKDNILLPLVLADAPVQEMEERLWPIAEKLGIDVLLEKYPYEVSGGQKQRRRLPAH